jgi:integrase
MARRRTGTLVLRKGVWHAQVTVDVTNEDGSPGTRREWYSLATDDRAIARRKLKRLVASLSGGGAASQAASIAGAPESVAEYFDANKGRLSEGDVDNIRLHVLDVVGSVAVTDLRLAHVKAIRDVALETVRRETAGKVLGAIRRLLDLAIEDEIIASNVAREIKIARARGDDREVKKTRVIMTDDEIARFLATPVDLEVRMMVAVSRCIGGMRTSDINTWAWEHIATRTFETCVVPRSKTAAPDELVIPPVARGPLRSWWERQGEPATGPVFPVRQGSNAGAFKAKTNSYANRFRLALIRSGVRRHVCTRHPPMLLVIRGESCCPNMAKDPLFAETATTLPTEMHSMRRAYNSALAAVGVNAQTALRLAGHTSVGVHMRYVHDRPEFRTVPNEALPALPAAFATDCCDSEEEGAKFCAPGRIRTSDLRLRRPLLFPD